MQSAFLLHGDYVLVHVGQVLDRGAYDREEGDGESNVFIKFAAEK